MEPTGYTPAPYPYDRLNRLKLHGEDFVGGILDLSVGTPRDPLPGFAAQVLADSASTAVGYPPSAGTEALRSACSGWLDRRSGINVDPNDIAVCIGTKEFVSSTPYLLHLRYPDRDVVLYPAVSYPSYAMGAELAGIRAVPVPVDNQWRLRLDAIDPDDAKRALCLWVNSPGNPAGALEDLHAIVNWARDHDVLVLSDECYFEFTWDTPWGPNPITGINGRSALETGSNGVIVVHSLSKRSNFAGGRAGFFTGDRDIVSYLAEVRKHLGLMLPGPIQAAATACWNEDTHVEIQRARYHDRLVFMIDVLAELGLATAMPEGGFYLWVEAPGDDDWAFTEDLARRLGVLASPGSFYGADSSAYVRLALVESAERLGLIAERARAGGVTFA